MALFDSELLADWDRDELVVFLVLLAVAGAAVGYEAGSVLAGEPFEPLWLVPILGLVAVVGAMFAAEAET